MPERNGLLEAELTALRRYARALSPTADQANDLVQDTVTRALGRWEQWRGVGPLRAWLFAIMRNSFYEDARRAARWRMVSINAEDAPPEPAAPEAIDPLFLRDLGKALEKLTDEQRETLFLVSVEGLSYAEAAELTGAPIGTVMSRLSRARARLRELTDGI